MEQRWWRVLLSIGLITLGALFLLENLQLLPWQLTAMQWFWTLIFGLAGAAFVAVFTRDRLENWWAVIPGFTLLGLAVVVSGIFTGPLTDLGPAIFMGMIGLSFWAIYATHRGFWWAVIPGGVLVTIALVIATSGLWSGEAVGAVFMLGLALTFLLVYWLPGDQGSRNTWAIWPAAGTGLIGLLILLGVGNLGRFVWPLILVVGGGILIFRALVPKNRGTRVE